VHTLALLLVAAAGAQASPAPQRMTVQMDCRHLTTLLRTYIGTRTDLLMHYSEADCLTSSLMQMFLRETSALLPVGAAAASMVNTTLAAHSPALAEVLVFALIGRHYTARFAADQFFFEYDPASQVLTPHMPRCEYQRAFLVLLLFVSVVLLVFALVSQGLVQAEAERAREHAAPKPVASAASLPSITAPLSLHQHMSIDFARLRRAPPGYAAL
jgi:hypothetical protein